MKRTSLPLQRRDFVTLLGGVAAWPFAARAQQPARVRRIGVLMPESANDAESQARSKAFELGLTHLGWVPGRDIQIDYRWAAGDVERARVATRELLALTQMMRTSTAIGIKFQRWHRVPRSPP
jgi:putative ABC transport system substrate-binding protein